MNFLIAVPGNFFLRCSSLIVLITILGFSQVNPLAPELLPPSANTFAYPQSVFIDVQGKNIWLTDFDYNRVLRFDVSTLSGLKSFRAETIWEKSFNISVYPNPFNTTATISIECEFSGRVSVEIYNILGKKITSLFDGNADSDNKYNIRFNAGNLTGGIYLCVLKTPYGSKAEKICLMK